MTERSPFRYFKTSPEIIRLAVMMYIRFPLSLRNVEDLLHERGIDISHETVRFWWNRFGPLMAAEIKQKGIQQLRAYSKWKWHVDEVFVKINGEHHYLWSAEKIVTARLISYGAALRDLGCPREQKTGRSLNIRAENSHHPFRRKRRAMQCFWQMRSLQKFAFVHAFVFNHFNQDRSQVRRAHFKQSRTAALFFEWRSLLAGQ